MNIKQKVKIKIQQMSKDILLNQTLLKLRDTLFGFIQIRVVMLKDLMVKSIYYQKTL